eukprot:s3116_g10.t1
MAVEAKGSQRPWRWNSLPQRMILMIQTLRLAGSVASVARPLGVDRWRNASGVAGDKPPSPANDEASGVRTDPASSRDQNKQNNVSSQKRSWAELPYAEGTQSPSFFATLLGSRAPAMALATGSATRPGVRTIAAAGRTKFIHSDDRDMAIHCTFTDAVDAALLGELLAARLDCHSFHLLMRS